MKRIELYPPQYVIIVGQGGCGKTQAVEFLAKDWEQLTGRKSVATEEPSRKNRQKIFDAKASKTKSGLEIVEMFYADRKDVVINPIVSLCLENRENCFSNRGYPCTQAYEGGGEGVSDEEIFKIHDNYLGKFFADVIFYLQLSDPEIGLLRKNKNFDGDAFDAESWAYHWRVKQKYDQMANDARPEFWITINADLPIPEVQKQLHASTLEYLRFLRN